jgi:hypothetical protein
VEWQKDFLAISRSFPIVFLSMEGSTPPLKSVAFLCVLDPAHSAGQLSVEEHAAATGGKALWRASWQLSAMVNQGENPGVPYQVAPASMIANTNSQEAFPTS